MSMPYKDQVLRGYQVCEINHDYHKAIKPETWLLLPKVNINGMEVYNFNKYTGYDVLGLPITWDCAHLFHEIRFLLLSA